MVVQRGGNADVKGICRSGGLCWWLCATKAETCDMMSNKYSHAVWMMMAGPSEPLYRWRFQITLRCCSQKLWYWASEKRLYKTVRCGQWRWTKLWTTYENVESVETPSKPGGQSLTWDKHNGSLFTGYAVDGVKVAWTLFRHSYGTWEPTGWC